MGHRVDTGRVTSDMLRAIPDYPHYLACSDGRIYERPVIDLDTGKTYPSIRDAAHATGLRRTGIWATCNKKQKTCGGRRWAYESEVAA